ncbi:unnamed protein product [Rhizophagus irregularis]|nr:unnamed protein product [Rhizophagus irregularis]CAB4417964.1 unnamed protein product [Rhizophagus irregularis]
MPVISEDYNYPVIVDNKGYVIDAFMQDEWSYTNFRPRFPLDPMWSWLRFHVMTTEDMDPDDLQLITNQKIPDVDQSDPVHKPESMGN